MIVQFRNEKVRNHGSIPITIDCNVVAFIVFEEGLHQPIKRTKQKFRNYADDLVEQQSNFGSSEDSGKYRRRKQRCHLKVTHLLNCIQPRREIWEH
ncbi:hypothetical protein TNCV_1588231 [Trichonephila clavipes]|uniref:Uncharacterized protein n=1 Tax=Trichonephila clavipes TaxID=2585209 RepID=A0A8X6UUX6_TRICX|nr:hypothetical protein TNCV_1588231 [Trichonephila clavipes]